MIEAADNWAMGIDWGSPEGDAVVVRLGQRCSGRTNHGIVRAVALALRERGLVRPRDASDTLPKHPLVIGSCVMSLCLLGLP